ncbi:hypothetical protein LMG32289_00643 [Cupriavidus pampae]|uniref:Lipoprotein n=2 Tax=Cupriavidus pampae TaxID=659251 RepID=A0ABN7XU39_9BURK|nr:hypothetical protein LMG32289_00643 [Cupriavidus pampae]
MTIRQATMVTTLAIATCACSPTNPYQTPLRWGAGPDALGPHVEVIRDEWIVKRTGRCYRRVPDVPIIEGVVSRDTEYCFNRGKLYAVRTYFDGEAQREQWVEWLTSIYGTPSSSVNVADSVGWGTNDVGIYLRYVAAHSYGLEDASAVTWQSVMHMPVIVWSPCNQWASGFQTCMERESRRIQAFDAR